MKKSIISFISVVCCIAGHAQFNYGYTSHTAQLTSVDKAMLTTADKALLPVDFKYLYKDIKGEAFFSPDWMNAVAYSQRGTKFTGFQAEFDLYKNSFYLNLHDTIYNTNGSITRFEFFPDKQDTVKKFIFSNQFLLPGVPSNKYVQVLNEGKLTFLKYVSKEVQEVQNGIYTNKEQTFNDKIYYYGVSASGQSIDITKLNKKNLQKILADKWDAVEKFAQKDSELSFSKEEDWQKLIKYYNSI